MSSPTSPRTSSHKVLVSRRRLAKRSHVLMEAMEPRRLLSGYTFTLADQGSSAANGTYLQKLINGQDTITGDGVSNHTIALGDTIILPDTSTYDLGVVDLQLPNLGAAATATINGNGQVTGAAMTFDGGGYTSAPTVIFVGGGGSGAAATATLGTGTNSGTVVGITMTSSGSGYTSSGLPQIAIEGGTLPLTIESSGYTAGSLGSGRINPATQEADLTKIATNNGAGIIVTTLSDSYDHSGAAQNYTFDGIEVAPDSDTDAFTSAFIQLGQDDSSQDYIPLVPTNFTFNQDYIHGGTPGETSDDLSQR